MAVKITGVLPGSPAERVGIKPGDTLVSINKKNINDVLDYRFYSAEKKLRLELLNGVKRIKKSEYEDLGLEFATYLMDEKRSCRNNCVFCFISQLPKGLRDTLYFKDDDARLSFLQGNYITLTNLSDSDIERIIKMKLGVNVSVHTTNPELRIRMLGNKNAGKSLDALYKIASAGNEINCQAVICPGINDGGELYRTISDLTSLCPQKKAFTAKDNTACPSVKSVACVPVGITRFRKNLPPIQSFTKQTAGEVIDIIDSFGDRLQKEYGRRLVYPADEFFLISEREIPPHEYYENYPQYENGVGMWRLLYHEFTEAMSDYNPNGAELPKKSVATGVLAAPLIRELAAKVNPNITVYAISNDFFGKKITVAGLVTAVDIINQLKGKLVDSELLIPRSMLRTGEAVFLDDLTVRDVEQALSVNVTPVNNDGYDLLNAFTV